MHFNFSNISTLFFKNQLFRDFFFHQNHSSRMIQIPHTSNYVPDYTSVFTLSAKFSSKLYIRYLKLYFLITKVDHLVPESNCVYTSVLLFTIGDVNAISTANAARGTCLWKLTNTQGFVNAHLLQCRKQTLHCWYKWSRKELEALSPLIANAKKVIYLSNLLSIHMILQAREISPFLSQAYVYILNAAKLCS